MQAGNMFRQIPSQLPEEIFEDLLTTENLRIERILSDGHFTPDGDWYDQEQSEWVMVLQGQGIIEYQDGTMLTLNVGDYVNIPAHIKHRVKSTSPDAVTIWLAIFYG
ncbi:cupin domain-containing protein [Vibrio variabilis]|uniref:cupin domain-containing protein n=1 Tax=Vibrio variabilis TaxID=990271 RepID=UPI000DD756DB|nr:cupin domain-containing protein [Vibrio variabilis]